MGRKYVGEYDMISYFPLSNADIFDLDNYKWPVTEDRGRIDGIEKQAREWYGNTDYSITATTAVSGIMFEIVMYLRGPEQFLTDLYLNKKFTHKIIRKITEISSQIYLYYIKPIGKYIDWIEYSEDFGMQDRAFISKDIFEEFFTKPHKEMFETRKFTKSMA